MKLFYTRSAAHLAKRINIKKGRFEIKRYADGEISVRIKDNIKGKEVFVIGSTFMPGDNFLELIFMLDALKRSGAKINLLIPYFGYARQDRVKEGEAFTGKVVCDILGSFKLKRIFVIHMHSSRLSKFLDYKDVIPYELYAPIIKKYEIVVAPDKGALEAVKKLSKGCKVPYAYMKKIRKDGKVSINKLMGDVKNKNVVIFDDMITTGGTMIEASRLLKSNGAKNIDVIATHGVLVESAVNRLRKYVGRIYVTDTLAQKSNDICIVGISKFIGRILIKLL